MTFEKTWLQYQTNLKMFLHSRVSDPDDVDDLLQDIMIKIYENYHSVKSEANVKSWLFQVSYNTIIDYYRKKRKAKKMSASDLWYEDTKLDPLTGLAKCISPFISALPRECAKLLTDIDINGQSQKEYAVKLGVSYSTLKSRVQKGRKQLRKLFVDCCHLSTDMQGNIIDYEPKLDHCDEC